jgi:hypothetical protein
MRLIGFATVSAAALSFGLALGADSLRAQAGRACDELGLNSPCITSTDLKPKIDLDEAGKDGRLRVRENDGAVAVELDAGSGNVTNLFSNDAEDGNGLVKAWAQIDGDGTVAACWRCNTDPDETKRLGDGRYEVDFTPLATDITGRPRSATIDVHAFVPGAEEALFEGTIILFHRFGDPSSVLVRTLNQGFATDLPFVLIIY